MVEAGRVVVVGLGPGDPGSVTTATLDAVARVGVRFVRTKRHPSAGLVGDGAASFDSFYEDAASLDECYGSIVDALVVAAREHGEVLYAVPGSPAVGERTVELLRARAAVGDVILDVLPAMSFLDVAWTRLGVDPVAAGARIVDGHRFAVEAAGARGPLLVAQCDTRSVLSEVKLAFEDAAPARAIVLQRLGLPDERVFEVPWDELDRAIEPDHLTSLWLPEFAAPVAYELAAFREVVRRLREECPWDRAQTHASLTRYVIEETYEVVEAIAALGADGVGSAELEEELGDLLLQVFLHSAIAAQEGVFTIADVARGITEKMVRRHPHVFGDVLVDDADHVARNWETIKAAEKASAGDGAAGKGGGAGGGAGGSVLDGVPGSLPALSYASELARKAAKIGFQWPDVSGVWAKLEEEIGELRAEPSSADELGDVLFVVVTLARELGHDPEGALRGASAKFRSRLQWVEAAARARGVELPALSFDQLDVLWQEAKAATAHAGGKTPR